MAGGTLDLTNAADMPRVGYVPGSLLAGVSSEGAPIAVLVDDLVAASVGEIPGTTADLPDSVGRRYVTEAEKSLLTSGMASATYTATTLALLNSYTGVPTGAQGTVTSDGVNTGIYQRGASSWTRTGDLPKPIIDGSGNVRVGDTALDTNTAGLRNVAIGKDALRDYLLSDSIAVGELSLFQATGVRNVAVGSFAGAGVTTGFNNCFFGYGSGAQGSGQLADASNSIALGNGSYTTQSHQFGLPDDIDHIRMSGAIIAKVQPANRNIFLGENAGRFQPPSSGANVALGTSALANITTAGNVVAIGDYAAIQTLTSINLIAIGSRSAELNSAAGDCVYVGTYTGRKVVSGVGDSVLGHRSLEHATVARNNSTLGDSAFWIYQGSSSVGIGYRAAEHLESGDQQVIIGPNAANGRKSGGQNVFIGANANSMPSVTVTRDEAAGTATGSVDAGVRNVGVGIQSLLEARSGRNTALGFNAGAAIIGTVAVDGNNTFLGYDAGGGASQLTTATNSIAIGAGSYTDANNQTVLGTSATGSTVLYGDIKLGRDVAAPVAKTIAANHVLAGTSNTAGAALYIDGSRGTGTGVGGDIVFRVSPEGSAGSSQNAQVNALAISRTGTVTMGGNIILPIANYVFWQGRSGIGSTADGNFFLRNNGGTQTALLTLGATGLTFDKAVNATTEFQVAGAKVVGVRDTGWAAMTGTSNKAATYDTSSVTLAQLAGRVMAMQASLTAHGLIGS